METYSVPYSGDVYESPVRRVSPLARLLPSWVLYAKEILVYWQAGHRAKAEGRAYDGPSWAWDSWRCLDNLESVGARFRIDGMDNFKGIGGPCVFAANHMSTLETVVLPGLIRPFGGVAFVIKRGLLRYPCFRDVLIACDSIVVDRVNPRDDLRTVMEAGCAKLAGGCSVVMFPQGTRHEVFDPADFNSLAVKLARRAGVPVVPVALHTIAWGHGRFLHDFGRIRPEIPVRIRFGAPVSVEGAGREAQAAVIGFIESTLRGWDPSFVKGGTDAARSGA